LHIPHPEFEAWNLKWSYLQILTLLKPITIRLWPCPLSADDISVIIRDISVKSSASKAPQSEGHPDWDRSFADCTVLCWTH